MGLAAYRAALIKKPMFRDAAARVAARNMSEQFLKRLMRRTGLDLSQVAARSGVPEGRLAAICAQDPDSFPTRLDLLAVSAAFASEMSRQERDLLRRAELFIRASRAQADPAAMDGAPPAAVRLAALE